MVTKGFLEPGRMELSIQILGRRGTYIYVQNRIVASEVIENLRNK